MTPKPKLEGARDPVPPVEMLVVTVGRHVITRPVRDALAIEYPTRTVSEANQREHWAKKAKRAKGQRAIAQLSARHMRINLPCGIVLTRIAPRMLDDDNLRGALKATRDGIADHLGISDNDPRVQWHYGQDRKHGAPRYYAVRVRVVSFIPEAPGSTERAGKAP